MMCLLAVTCIHGHPWWSVVIAALCLCTSLQWHLYDVPVAVVHLLTKTKDGKRRSRRCVASRASVFLCHTAASISYSRGCVASRAGVFVFHSLASISYNRRCVASNAGVLPAVLVCSCATVCG